MYRNTVLLIFQYSDLRDAELKTTSWKSLDALSKSDLNHAVTCLSTSLFVETQVFLSRKIKYQ